MAGVLLTSALKMGLTFAFTCLAWIFFRAQSSAEAFEIINRIIEFDGLGPQAIRSKFMVAKGALVIAMLLAVDVASTRERLVRVYQRSRALQAFGMLLCLWAISILGSFGANQFIYFQF